MPQTAYTHATIIKVHHWNDTLFSFVTSRDPGLRFENGQFIMVGMKDGDKPIMRAYSIASANHEDYLEFFSIKVPNGPLTSKLQDLTLGDQIILSKKPTGTLVIRDLKPGRNLYLLATGTGLAPFLSISQDPETYLKFDKVIVVHGVRYVSDLAYREFMEQGLPNHEYLGDIVKNKMIYYPTVTREDFPNKGRISTLIETGKLTENIGLPPLDPAVDRLMICGSPAMIKDCRVLLDARGFEMSPYIGAQGDYVIERAFVDK